jgi:hypothetical protein
LIVPVAVVLVEILAGAVGSPLTTTAFIEGRDCAPCCARASAFNSLRRAGTLIPPRSSRTIRVIWAVVGFVPRIDSNR